MMTPNLKFYRVDKFGTVDAQGIHLRDPDQRDIDNAIEKLEKDGFDTVHIYSDTLAVLSGHAWERPSSYMGPQYFGYIGIVGTNRDACLVTKANYDAIKADAEEKFGKLTFTVDDDEFPIVETADASHWACGWVSTLMVHWSSLDAMLFAAEVLTALEQYPVYSEDAYNDEENAYKEECMTNYHSEWKTNVLKWLGLTRFGNAAEWVTVLWYLYDYECGYCGTEEAYIDVSDMDRLARDCRHEFQRIADKNKIAARILQKAGLA